MGVTVIPGSPCTNPNNPSIPIQGITVQGATGSQFVCDGAPGSAILSGSGVPTNSANNGDFYFDTTERVLYGPYDDGWPSTGTSLVGAQGQTGAQGAQGPQGAQGAPGPQGPAGASGTSALFGTNSLPAVQDPNPNGSSCTLGEVNLVAGIRYGNNWMAANGSPLQIMANQALFSLLGTTYGGDGITTFDLPNLEAAAPNGTTYVICATGVFP